MSTSSSQLLADVAQLHADSGILHQIVHGPASGPGSGVETDGGVVVTAAAAIANVQGAADAAIEQVEREATDSISQMQALANAQGYKVPAAYAAGIAMTLPNQTVEYNGQAYAPIAAALPFTTSGTFETAKFRLIQGVSEADLSASSGTSLVGFVQNLPGAAPRQLEQKEREVVSVTDWPGGPLDHTTMFSLAAQNAPGIDNVPSLYSAIPHPITAFVRVPAGNYTISSLVDTGGREVTWLLDPGANVAGIDYLNGVVVRDGARKTRMIPLGTMDQAAGGCFTVGGTTVDKTAPVLGVTSTQQMADYTQRDAVGLVAAAYSYPFLINAATASYTANTATIAPQTADVVKRLRPGMVIYTGHATRCCGILQSWSADGSVLTVPEWRAKGGSTAVTPDNSAGLTIGTDKLWAINGVVELTPDGSATQAIGQELSVRNGRGDSSTDLDNTTNNVRGYLAAAPAAGTPGYYKSQAAFIARGSWIYGFVSQEQDIGFNYRSTTAKIGYQYYGTGYGIQFINPTNGYLSVRVNYTGDLELGTREAAAPSGRNIRWNVGGFSNAYDAQISVTGGASGSNGAATMALSALNITSGGNLYPSNNNVRSLGLASNLWTVVYASSGTINTSDGTLKTLRNSDGIFTDVELAAWGDARQLIYQFNDSIEEKGGDCARLHAGYIAQSLQAAFAAHGLDVTKYGFWCEDDVTETVSTTQTVKRQKMTTVDETVDVIELVDGVPTLKKKVVQKEIGVVVLTHVVDERGNQVLSEYTVVERDSTGNPILGPDGLPILRMVNEPVMYEVPVLEDVEETVEIQRPAGKQLALRYSECAVWEAAYMRARVAALGDRVAALESKAGPSTAAQS